VSVERKWYLMYKDEEQIVIGLTGPIKGGQAEAKRIMQAMLDIDQQLADAVVWDDPDICATPMYAHIQVVDLSPNEIKMMGEIG